MTLSLKQNKPTKKTNIKKKFFLMNTDTENHTEQMCGLMNYSREITLYLPPSQDKNLAGHQGAPVHMSHPRHHSLPP